MKIMRRSNVSTIITVTTAAAMVTMVSSITGTRVVVSLPGDGVGVIPESKNKIIININSVTVYSSFIEVEILVWDNMYRSVPSNIVS